MSHSLYDMLQFRQQACMRAFNASAPAGLLGLLWSCDGSAPGTWPNQKLPADSMSGANTCMHQPHVKFLDSSWQAATFDS